MNCKTLLATAIVCLASLVATPSVHAWGAVHVGVTRVGYGGVYHVGATAVGGYGYAAAGIRTQVYTEAWLARRLPSLVRATPWHSNEHSRHRRKEIFHA